MGNSRSGATTTSTAKASTTSAGPSRLVCGSRRGAAGGASSSGIKRYRELAAVFQCLADEVLCLLETVEGRAMPAGQRFCDQRGARLAQVLLGPACGNRFGDDGPAF